MTRITFKRYFTLIMVHALSVQRWVLLRLLRLLHGRKVVVVVFSAVDGVIIVAVFFIVMGSFSIGNHPSLLLLLIHVVRIDHLIFIFEKSSSREASTLTTNGTKRRCMGYTVPIR